MKLLIMIGLVSFLCGGGLTAGIMGCHWKRVEPIVIPPNPVKMELSRLDIIEPICDPKFIADNGDALCREMFCQAQSHGDATSESTCENISNLRNKIAIQEFCSKNEDQDERTKCIDLFFRRGS